MPVEIAAEVDREAQRRGPGAGTAREGGAGEAAGAGRKVERIVGRAVRKPSPDVKRPRALRAAKKPGSDAAPTEATVSRLPQKSTTPGLQLIRGRSEGGDARARAGAKRRKASHLRVV
jgi:hypothetical protein